MKRKIKFFLKKLFCQRRTTENNLLLIMGKKKRTTKGEDGGKKRYTRHILLNQEDGSLKKNLKNWELYRKKTHLANHFFNFFIIVICCFIININIIIIAVIINITIIIIINIIIISLRILRLTEFLNESTSVLKSRQIQIKQMKQTSKSNNYASPQSPLEKISSQ